MTDAPVSLKRRGRSAAIPDADAARIGQLLAQGYGDAQVASIYGCGAATVCNFRKRHGIPAGRRKGRPHGTALFPFATKTTAASNTKVQTYIDSTGRSITVCPPAYASGAYPFSGSCPQAPPAPATRRDPFRSLWRAVILQAILDCRYSGNARQGHSDRRQAEGWLSITNPDFRTVCDLAEMHPEHVATKAQHAIDSKMQWRAAPGEGKHYHERRKYRQRELLAAQ